MFQRVIIRGLTAKIIAWGWIFFGSLGTNFSQTTDPHFARISTDQGLSQSTVTCIIQDTMGFMWFGTWDGLNRYDGYSITVFRSNTNDNTSISHNHIRSMHVDRSGTLWVGTEGGLNRYNSELEEFERFEHNPAQKGSISHNGISCFTEDPQRNLWIGTKGGGINLYHPETRSFSNITANTPGLDNPRANIIYSLEWNEAGNYLILGTENGIYKYQAGKQEFEQFENPDLQISTAVLSILQENENLFWFSTWGQGIIQWDATLNTCRLFKSEEGNSRSIPGNVILSMILDNDKQIWIGTRGNGIGILDRARNSFIQVENDLSDPLSLSDNSIFSQYRSHDGQIWIGTQLGGINKYNPAQKQFSHIRYKPGDPGSLSNNIVTAILEDENQILWIGTRDGGLNRIDRSRNVTTWFKHQPGISNSLSSNYITSIVQDSNNPEILWIGTDGGGLNKFNSLSNQFIRFTPSPSKPGSISTNDIYTLAFDSYGRLWTGAWGNEVQGGIDVLDKNSEKFFNYRKVSDDSTLYNLNVVLKIVKDKRGIFWIGTKGSGLARLILDRKEESKGQPGHWTFFKHDPDNPHSLSHNDVYTIHQDASGYLWVGTVSGLNRYEPEIGGFSHYTIENGLPSNVIYGILDDSFGSLWISTAKGLARISPSGEIKIFHKDDGLQEDVYYPGASFKNSKGELFFGGINGLSSFYPDSIEEQSFKPKIIITGLRIFNRKMAVQKTLDPYLKGKSILLTREIELTHRDYMVTIEFSDLDFISPGKKSFSYKLEGFSEEWIPTSSNERRATFTNLEPGQYKFQVIITGSPTDGSNGASLFITVIPPFYNTLWFKVVISILLALGFTLGFMRRIEGLRKEKETIEKKAEESLFEERNQLRTLIDNMPDFIYIKDRQSRYIAVNRRLARIMGNRTPEELIGKNDHIYFTPETANRIYNDEQELMRTGVPMINHVEPGIDEKGNKIWISVTKIPLRNSQTEVVGLVAISRDITQLKQTEERLIDQTVHLQEINVALEERQEEVKQQAEELQVQTENLSQANVELERLNATKDKLFSIIAHDLKNPFHAISGFTNLLSKNFKTMSTVEKTELLDLINVSAETAYNLLDSL